MKKEDIIKLEKEAMKNFDQIQKDEWRLKLHLMPPVGWLNDPNGLCQFQGVYHVYYQYSPYDINGKTHFWGHYTSEDLIHWRREDTAIYSDCRADEDGAFSGSTYLHDGKMHVFYTGNVKYKDKEYDYISQGREQNLIYVSSEDGYHFTKKKWLLKNEDYPDNLSCHVRDPKIFDWNDERYMVMGARDKESKGCILLLKGNDLLQWEPVKLIRPKNDFGYMWECPDMFFLDGRQVLVTCPQGVESQGINYANVHQCGYFLIKKGTEGIDVELENFQQLDRGHDFYAPQSFLDEKGRRIMIGWMGISDNPFGNPTMEKGWQQALTIPRELRIKGSRMLQNPIDEMKKLRKESYVYERTKLPEIVNRDAVFELEIEANGNFLIQFSKDCVLTYAEHFLTLEMGACGYGRTPRSVYITDLKYIRIFVDTSALEIFANYGEEVMTSRYYAKLENRELKVQGEVKRCIIHKLEGLVIDWNV